MGHRDEKVLRTKTKGIAYEPGGVMIGGKRKPHAFKWVEENW